MNPENKFQKLKKDVEMIVANCRLGVIATLIIP